ncbi:DUF397 domain-containing protein [Saccharothrix yanglingensis]|uniref:DUF397 domain-containing protein n=1 Tax=Saccharothrix yanglingensis TaxID=659496 RepID=A0ABU0WT08_9PSEU|nr:DUF397 domain-containing protein [Saccharothrix yanglingensis]MDQ2582976.1 DUF397 domain-containing protein [Saccharothrix yanglingensis]
MTAQWFTSSYSSGGSNACVEVGFAGATVGVRDSKNTAGPAFAFSGRAWRAFVRRVSSG